MAGEACSKLTQALRQLLDPLGLSPEHIRSASIDPHGPRIILDLEPPWANGVSIDASPDGVEAVVAIPAPRGLDPEEAEEAALQALEEAGITGVDEYDAAYDPQEGELVIEIHASLITHIPRLPELAEKAAKALAGLQEKQSP